MKRIYNQPAVQVAQFASMTLMQAASPASAPVDDNTMVIGGGYSDIQW